MHEHRCAQEHSNHYKDLSPSRYSRFLTARRGNGCHGVPTSASPTHTFFRGHVEEWDKHMLWSGRNLRSNSDKLDDPL